MTSPRYQPVERTLGLSATADQRERFEREGLLACEQFLDRQEVATAKEVWRDMVERLHTGGRAGRMHASRANRNAATNYAGASVINPATRSSLQFEPGCDGLDMPFEEAQFKIRNTYSYQAESRFFASLVQDRRITSMVDSLIGESCMLFQTMALAKPARVGVEKPWHQDDAYFSYAPLNKVVGIWIALDDANAQNGCMHVLPGWHNRGGLKHQHTFDCTIIPDRLDLTQARAVELPAGGAMFFSGMLPHQTPPNRSPQHRLALQFHYRGLSTVSLSRQEYDRAFAEADGTPASCVNAR